jgi:16S rRNA (cytosine967-C5)-methyltransferase
MAKMLAGIFGSAPEVIVADVRELPPFAAPFGAVLADVPCSGLGTLRRNPEIKWRFGPSEFDRLSRVQGEILHSVSSAVRPGGYLLYSTCSTEPEEDECVVDRFLRLHPEFRMVRPPGPAGIDDLLDERGMLRTFPSEHRWDGFFGALMAHRS